MKKKIIKILSIIFIFIVTIVIISHIDLSNQTKERMIEHTKNLMDSISRQDYDKIKIYLQKPDGTKLSDQEITNFLFNTGLYRATIVNSEEKYFTYTTSVNLFDSDKGTISFSFKALDGTLITNQLKYVDTYLVTDKIQEPTLNKIKYPMATDLANGEHINNDNEDDEENLSSKILSYVKDENGNLYIEIIEDVKEDIKIVQLNAVDDVNKNLKGKNENYYFELDKENNIFSVYYDESIKEDTITNSFINFAIWSPYSIYQVLNGNEDWHVTINYYDYNTKELLKSDIIR